MSLLKLQNINTGYDKKQVLFDVDLELKAGETILLIGSNGSGKSTLLKTIYRLLPVWKMNGRDTCVEYDNFSLLDKKPHQLIQSGMVYIPQKNELFDGMSVQQNLEASALHMNGKALRQDRLALVYEDVPALKEKRKRQASQLSGGERKQLSLGMAMMNLPKLLMLDEPLAGVATDRIDQVKKVIEGFKEKGTTLLIVEHRVKEFFDFVDRVLGMQRGTLLSQPISSIDNAKKFLI